MKAVMNVEGKLLVHFKWRWIGQFFYYFQTKSMMMHSRSVVAHICTPRCRIAEKYFHFICISLNNKSVYCIMPHNFFKKYFFNFLQSHTSLNSQCHRLWTWPFSVYFLSTCAFLEAFGGVGEGCRKLEFFLVSCYLFTGYSNYYISKDRPGF